MPVAILNVIMDYKEGEESNKRKSNASDDCNPSKKKKYSMEDRFASLKQKINDSHDALQLDDDILLWLLKTIKTAPTQDKTFLLSKILDILKKKSENFWLPASSTALALIDFVTDESIYECPTQACICVTHILRLQTVNNLLKDNVKLLGDVFVKTLRNCRQLSTEGFEIFSLLASMYLTLASRETAVLSFIKFALPTLGTVYSSEHNELDNKLKCQKIVQFCQNMLFTNVGLTDLSVFLANIFENKRDKCARATSLIKVLSTCVQCDMKNKEKEALLQVVLEALCTTGKVDDVVLVRFVILLAHFIGVEQMVSLAIDGKSRTLCDPAHIADIVKVDHSSTKANFKIWSSILQIISKRSVNLTGSLPGVTGLQWFQGLATCIIAAEKFNHSHIDVLSHLFSLDSLIIEPLLAKIFRRLFAKSSKFLLLSYLGAYEKFMLVALRISSRLQRCHKFIAKLLNALASAKDIDPSHVLSSAFLDNLSSTVTTLPSAHVLRILTNLHDCFENAVRDLNNGGGNAALLQVAGHLLSVSLGSCKLLCYTLPRSVIDSFVNLINRLKDVLASFSSFILLQPHDKKIMQPFLRVCFAWGEIQILIRCYATNETIEKLSEDASPSDLSPLLNFANGEQWSVFAERITNFGDEQCNRYLVKLILQKLKVAHLIAEKNGLNSEATATYLLKRLKSDVHGLTVVNTMTPEEMNITLHCLSDVEAKALVTTMFEQLDSCNMSSVEKWLEDPALLENRRYVSFLFEAAFNFLILTLEETLGPLSTELRTALCQVAETPLSSDHVALLKEKINEAFESETRVELKEFPCEHLERLERSIKSLPFSYLATSSQGAALSSLTALLVALDGTPTLLPYFESLIKSTEDVASCFNVDLCVKWLMSRVTNKTTRASIIELLVIKSVASEEGVEQFKSLMKSLKHQSFATNLLEVMVVLYNAIRKCWGQGKQHQEKNAMLASQRKSLVRRIQHSLEEANAEDCSDAAVQNAYSILLMIYERKGKVGELADLKFSDAFASAIQTARTAVPGTVEHDSSLNLLTAVLKCSNAVRELLSEDFVCKIWREVKENDCEKLCTHICAAASESEYSDIVCDLLNSIQGALGPPQYEDVQWVDGPPLPEPLRPLFFKINHNAKKWPRTSIEAFKVFSMNATDNKLVIWQKALLDLFKQTDHILPCSKDHKDLMNWLKFLHFVATSTKVAMTSRIQDYLLDVLYSSPTENVPFIDNFIVRIEILSALIGPKSAFFREKVHLVFLAFKQLLNWLVHESDTSLNLEDTEAADRAQAGFHLEKWCTIFIQKEVGRELSLFLIEIITSLTTVSLLVPVKMHLMQSAFILLRLADEHTVQFLMRILPVGSQQIFTNLYSQFQRFYKYKGKI